MEDFLIHYFHWIIPASIVAVSLLIGIWLRSFALPRLFRVARQTEWDLDDLILKAVRGPVVVWALMVGIYLAVVFSKLPPHAGEVSGHVLQALWILSAAWVASGVVSELITRYAARWQLALPTTSLTQNLARFVILSLAGLVILDSFGVRIGSLLAALGVGSLAVALGLQETLANLFAGLHLMLSHHIQVGDYIKLDGGQEGYVTDIGWRSTKIRMLPNNIVIVANAKLAQSIIVNYYLPDKELAVTVEVGVDYDSDLERVEHVTVDVAREVMREVAGGVPTFEPMVRYHTFAESSVNCTVVLRAKEFVDQYTIKHEFIKRLHARYRREGITIPFPCQTVYMKDDAPFTRDVPAKP